MKMNMNTSRHAFTLVEMLAAIVVMSIISVVIMPVIASASDSYAVARNARTSTERTGFALTRIATIIQSAPIGPIVPGTKPGVGVTSATTNSIQFTDNTGVQLSGTTLQMLVPGKQATSLCFNVDQFTISYLADDGMTDTMATPSRTHRFVFQLTAENVTMAILVHPRVWIGQTISP